MPKPSLWSFHLSAHTLWCSLQIQQAAAVSVSGEMLPDK